jgi:cysteine synthase
MITQTDAFKMSDNKRIENLWKKVGNTPLEAIAYSYMGGPVQEILVKCEHYNIVTHSIKDRMALYMLQKAYEQRKLRDGDLIIEASTGNTGISMAAIGRALGHRVKIVMPEWTSIEIRSVIKQYGADVQLISKNDGGFLAAIEFTATLAGCEGIFLPSQFENQYNIEAHEKTTSREIGYSLLLENIRPAAFVAGVGTGGTLMGVGKYLQTLFPGVGIHPLEPAETHHHRIYGIADIYSPKMLNKNLLDSVVKVNDGDGILMAQKLSKELGMGVGISSGANLAGAIKLQQEIGFNRPVVTIFPDDNKKYVSTDLFKEEPVKDHYITPAVKFLGSRVLTRM